MTGPATLLARAAAALAALGPIAVLGSLAGCGLDNPACIFGPGTCVGIVGGLSSNPAFLPVSGQVIRDGPPVITSILPDAAGASPDTPVVIVFSESIAAETLGTTFTINDAETGVPAPTSSRLLADGRMLVLLPIRNDPDQPALVPGFTYQVRYNQGGPGGGMVTDLTGQELDAAALIQETFVVAANVQDAPRVLTTFPPAGATGASTTTEFTVVFDRPVDPTSVTTLNLFAQVDGMPLTFPPEPFQPLVIELPFGAGSATDTRVYSYQRRDAAGELVPLKAPGAAGAVNWTISTMGTPIMDAEMDDLAPTTVTFTLSDLFAPAGATFVSAPDDAIGIRNLVDPMGGPGDLAIDVSLAQGLTDDVVTAYLFGNSHATPPVIGAVKRDVVLTMDFNSATFGAAELELALDLVPLRPLFADGDLAIAFQQRRGSEVSPLFVVDVDPDEPGLQDPVFDTTRPELVGFGPAGVEQGVLRSPFRDLVVVGRANEALRSVAVSVQVGAMTFDNGMTPPVVGSAPGRPSLFLAAPVDLPGNGTLDASMGPYPITVRLLDRALNESAQAIAAEFEQIGNTAPGDPLAGGTFDVQVFDAATLLPLVGARVFTHQDDAGTVTPLTTPPAVLTDASGMATVPSAVVGETIVTIEATGHELFTLHGVTVDRLSILLAPAVPLGLTMSTVSADGSGTNFPSLDRRGADSRVAPEDDIVVALSTCFSAASMVTCTGAAFIRPNTIGAASVLGASFPSSVGTYSAQSFLRAFEFTAPTSARDPFDSDAVLFDIDFLLDDPILPDEELAIDWLPQPVLDPSTASGLDLGMLAGPPEIVVQANVPGVPGSATVGLGITFDDTMGGFDVRAAYAGAVDPTADSMSDAIGRLIESGSVEPILRLRAELAEATTTVSVPGANATLFSTKRAGARPRLAQMEATLRPLGVPTVMAPLPGNMPVLDGYDIVVAGTIDTNVTATGKRGLYHAQVLAANGRTWHVWRADQNNAPGGTVRLHVPAISLQGGAPPTLGPRAVRVSAYAWAGFTFADFAWTDVEREYDLFAHTPLTLFNVP